MICLRERWKNREREREIWRTIQTDTRKFYPQTSSLCPGCYIMYTDIVVSAVYIYMRIAHTFIIRILCTYTREHVWHPTVKVKRNMRIENNNNNNIPNTQNNNKIRLDYVRCLPTMLLKS